MLSVNIFPQLSVSINTLPHHAKIVLAIQYCTAVTLTTGIHIAENGAAHAASYFIGNIKFHVIILSNLLVIQLNQFGG